MTFKIGDYVVHYDYPQNLVVLHITNDMYKQVINDHADEFRHATEEEIKQYHEGLEEESESLRAEISG